MNYIKNELQEVIRATEVELENVAASLLFLAENGLPRSECLERRYDKLKALCIALQKAYNKCFLQD